MAAVLRRLAGPSSVIAALAFLYVQINSALHVASIGAAATVLYLHCLSSTPRREMAVRALLTVILMPLIAWAIHNPWLLYAIMLAWVPLVAGDAGRAVPVYLLSLLLLPGLDSTVSIGSLKLFDFGVHDALAVGATIVICRNRRKMRPGWRLDLPAFAIVFLIAAALSRETSLSNFLRFTSNVVLDLGVPYYLVSRGVRDIDELRRALLWMGCGAVTLGSILVYEAMRGWPIYNELNGQYGLMPFLIKARGGMLRAGGPFIEPTSAAMVLAICMLALWVCGDAFRSRRHHGLVFLIAFAGLVAPQSRGAWIGLGFALVLGELYLGRYRPLLKRAMLAGCGLSVLLLAALSSPSLSESLGLSGGSSDTSEYRRQLFDRGMEEYWHSPVIGFSMPELNIRLHDLRQGEGIIDFVNTYIWIMLISGGIGLILFVGAFFRYMMGLYRCRKPTGRDRSDREVAAFLFCCLAMTMEMLFFTSFGTRPAVFIFVLFGFAATYLKISGEPFRRRPARPVRAAVAS
ncbi:hypothetical protein A0J57_08800 [Sphingobium sp. 22B]|uniref:O-antigen ligase family protein n=1 Tax=unclassified Sphingobium TaxID=2611147 RepID=UPI000783575D|nr:MULTISPECIES: O-antigen ligase family protein [unclassified Sphingobium]KXU32642.1 hypothetical protein AXW74_06295 [Sphingobium sp. AM]KYC32719.1 hypothetical protein A0J57_08800 [Sphingobium sp. 22B]OAP31608.1 hypothetical protein A8O16_12255 [Sphingobium sp. 20006FA]